MIGYYFFILILAVELSVLGYMIIDGIRSHKRLNILRKRGKELDERRKEMKIRIRILDAVVKDRKGRKYCQNCKALLKLRK